MTPVEVHLKALEVLEAAAEAGEVEPAVAAMRLELEVLSREDLIRVAMALAVECALVIPGPAGRPGFRQRLGIRRTAVMVGPL